MKDQSGLQGKIHQLIKFQKVRIAQLALLFFGSFYIVFLDNTS